MDESAERNHGAEVTLSHSAEQTTQTHLLHTTTESSRQIYGTTLELHTILPIAGTLLVFLILVLCLRFHIYATTYKRWAKHLRRLSSRSQDGDNSVDEEMFKPPPEYTTAVSMPKPCGNCLKNHQSVSSQKQCPCNKRTLIDEETPETTCQCKLKGEENGNGGKNTELVTTQAPNAESCVVTFSPNLSSNDLVANGHSSFIILDNIQRMARDPTATVDHLPTYEDYVKEFPDQDDCV